VCQFTRATFEAGEVVEDPSEDRLFIMLGRLEAPENSNLVIEPCDEPCQGDAQWYVVISLLGPDRYELEFRDPAFGEHELRETSSKSEIARDVTVWVAERFGITGIGRGR
jgi:hypothetical protein